MNIKVKKEVERLIKYYNLNCSIEEFKDKVDWTAVSIYQKLSELFIREFQDKVNCYYISVHQTLSESFIKEFKDKIRWLYISQYQTLSEKFIAEFRDKVNWYGISGCQKLSEKFIREFENEINIKLYDEIHKKKTKRQKLKEIKLYAKKYKLKYDKEYLYSYREHDHFGRGMFNKTICYKKGKYYKDWKCDMREEEQDSFGLGIFPIGNTKVKVKIEDWGVEVKNSNKARVWGFEIV